ncbi:hypothetical protein HC762_00005, partial [bacterium]|nr:hypothetical protein [bacterium]
MTLFFRLLETNDKGTALHQAIQQLAQKRPNPNTFAVEPESFQQVPGAPFAYSVSSNFRSLFERLSATKQLATVAEGLNTTDNDRFLRLSWEVQIDGGIWV